MIPHQFPNSTKGGESVICVQRLLIYGLDSAQVQPLNDHVKTTSLATEARHTVSVRLAARLTRFSASFLLGWASTGERFCQLEWIFQDFQFPKFTTRHVLVEEEATEIGFAGGLKWAYDMLLSFHPPLETSDEPELEHSPIPDSPKSDQTEGYDFCDGSSSRTCDNAAGYGPAHGGPYVPLESSLPRIPNFPPFSAPQCGDIASRLPAKDLTAAQGYPALRYEDDCTDELASLTSLTTGTTRPSSPELPTETPYGRSRPDQYPIDREKLEALSQQRQAAVAQYEKNGDKSAMLSLLNSAAQFDGAWDSAGFARFGPARDQ